MRAQIHFALAISEFSRSKVRTRTLEKPSRHPNQYVHFLSSYLPDQATTSSKQISQQLTDFTPSSENIDKMGDATVVGSKWRFVEVGRVVLVQSGPNSGKLGTIVEIIDHKRVRAYSATPDWKGGHGI